MGGGLGQPGAGVPGGFPDRASMLAANPNVVFQQGPMVAQQGQVQPTQAQEPTDPIQRYQMGLSPLDDQGDTFPNWESLDPEYKEQIWQMYAGQTGIDLSAAQQQGAPQYESLPNLRIRGNPDDPNQQTRQYAAPLTGVDARAAEIMRNMPEAQPQFEPSLTPSSPAMNDAALLERARQPVPTTPQEHPDLSIVQSQWTNPPPGWSESPEDDADWQTMSQSSREKVWRMYAENLRRTTPTRIENDPTRQTTTANPVGGVIRGGFDTVSGIASDIRQSPPGQAVENYVVDPVIAAASYLQHKNEQQVADASYYMITHDGELPGDWTDPGTWVTGWLASGNGSAFNPGSEEYFAAAQIVDRTKGEDPANPGTWSKETVAAYVAQTGKDPFATDGNSNPLAQMTILTYLRANKDPQLWAAAQAAYEEGGADGMLAWFAQDVGPWWNFAQGLILDPLNAALGLAIPARQLGIRAATRSLQEGSTVSRGTRAMGAAAEGLRLASDPISYPVEKVIERSTKLGRRLAGRMTEHGEAGARRTAEEIAQEQEHVVGGLDPAEAEANRLRAEQAQANADAESVARAEEARKKERYADMWTERRNRALEKEKEALEREAANTAGKEEAAARREIQDAIKAGDQRRVAEIRARRTAAEAEERAAQQEIKDAIRAGDKRRADEARGRQEAERKRKDAERERARRDAEKARRDAARAEDGRKIEDARQLQLDRARIRRDAAIKQASTPKGRENALIRHEAKLAEIDAEYQTKVAAWERAHGGSYADEIGTPSRPVQEAPVPEPESQTTIFETPRPGSTIDSIDQKQAEYDSMVLRTQERRAAESAPVDTTIPVERRMVNDDDLARNPDEAEAFMAETRRRIEDEYAPIDRAMDRGQNQRANRAIHDAEFQSSLESDYVARFDRPSNYTPEGLFKKYSQGTEEGAIVRFVFGRPDEARQAWGLLEQFATGNSRVAGHIRTRMDDLVEYRNRVWADADEITSAPSTIAPSPEVVARARGIAPEPPRAQSPETSPRADLANEVDISSLPERFRTLLDEYRADILDPDPDVSRQAAHLMHTEGRKLMDRDQKKLWKSAINRLRDQSGHVTRRAARKPKGAAGIVFDPADGAQQFAEKVHTVIGRATDWVNPITRNPTRIAGGKAVVKGHVKHADRLQEAWRENVNLTQRQVDTITAEVTLTVGTGKNTQTITTNFWDSYIDNLDAAAARRRGSYRKNGYPTTDEGWADEIKLMTDERDAALIKTKEMFSQLYAAPQANKAVRATKAAMGANRKYLQFNIVTGPRAIFNDIVTNEKFMVLTGQGGAIRRQHQLLYAMVKDHLDQVDILDHSVFKRVRDSGVTQLPPEIKHTIGREEVERGGRRRALNPANLIESYWIKTVRGAGDNASRYAIYANYFDGHLLEEKAKFLNFVRGKVKKNRNEDLFNEIRDLVQRDFNADQVREITRKYGADDSYARTWAKQIDDLSQAATAKQRQIMFSYKKTKMDDAMGKVFLFHYYMTRSTALYTKLMLQHPQLISLEATIWEHARENMKQFPGAPEWMEGFIGIAQDNGHAMFTNPTMLVSGIGVLQSLGEGGFSRSSVEQGLNATGLMIQPLVKSGLAILGMTLPGDPTGTTQIRRAAISFIDKARFSDFGKARGWDTRPPWGDRPMPDFLQDVVTNIVDMANDAFRELGAPIRDFDAATSDEVKEEQVKATLVTNFQEEGGSSDPEEWPEDVYNRYIAALVALEDGTPNADVDVAVEEYVDMQFEQTYKNAALPTGAYIRDAQTDVRQKRERDAGNVPYQERTPAQEADVAANDLESAQSPEAVRLTAGMQRYNNAGTDNQEIVNSGYNQIVFGYEDIPDNYKATIGGKTYTGAQLKAMTDDEREQLANEYVAEESARAGIVQGARAGAGGTATADPLGTLKEERAAIKAEVPEVADYTKYRSYMLNDERDVRQMRQDMLAAGTGTQFYKQHEEYRKYQIEQGKTGEELEAAMDDWMTSDSAYLAVLGHAGRNKTGTGSAIYSATNPAPWREETSPSTGGGGGSFPSSQTGEDIDEGIDFDSLSAEDARDLIRTDSISPDGVEKLVDNGTVTTRILRRWIDDGTLLHDDLYQMAAQPNLTATDLKYMFEDGYLTMDDLIRLITDADEEFVTEVRTENRRRKRARERKSERDAKKSTSSGGYQPRGFFREYLGTPGS